MAKRLLDSSLSISGLSLSNRITLVAPMLANREKSLTQAFQVLLVGQNQFLLKGMGTWLGDNGFDVIGTAATEEEALASAIECLPDIVLMDEGATVAPDTFCQRLQHDQHPAQVVVLIGEIALPRITQLIRAGVLGLASKNDDPEFLLQALHAVATAGELWISPRISLHLMPRLLNQAQVSKLSERETQILSRVAAGYLNEEVGDELGLSAGTVRNYLSSVYAKLGVHTRAQATAWAWEHGMVHAGPLTKPTGR